MQLWHKFLEGLLIQNLADAGYWLDIGQFVEKNQVAGGRKQKLMSCYNFGLSFALVLSNSPFLPLLSRNA